MLNITFVRSESKELTPLDLISHFDINCTQIAVDIETEEIVLSKYFEDFIATGELKIVDIGTPEHTAIRFVKKANEFGFYANYERELSKVAVVIRSNKKRYFSEKYLSYYKKYREILEQYFKLSTYENEDIEINLYTISLKKSENGFENPFEKYILFHNKVGVFTRESILRTNKMFIVEIQKKLLKFKIFLKK